MREFFVYFSYMKAFDGREIKHTFTSPVDLICIVGFDELNVIIKI